MTALAPLSTDWHPFKMKVDEFLMLSEAGAFDDYAKSELIEGEIFCMNAQLSRHARAKSELFLEIGLILRRLDFGLNAMVEVATQVSDYSLPEPDIVVSSYTGDRQVMLENVRLVIEVSDTTLNVDLGRKKRLYATSGVPEYWVIDVNRRGIHQFWKPEGDDFDRAAQVKFGDTITAQTIEDFKVGTASLG